MTKAGDEDQRWKVDRHIPLALIFTILAQTGIGIWWAASVNERVAALEAEKNGRSGKLESIAVDIAVLKEKAESTNRQITEVRDSLQTLTTQLLPQRKSENQ